MIRILVLLFFAYPAHAIVIEIDPGDVGEVEHDNIGNPVLTKTFSLATAEGVLDLVFADMKHIELLPFVTGPASQAFAVFELSTSNNVLSENIFYNVFLSDKDGAEIPGTGFFGITLGNGVGSADPIDLFQSLLFHDIHYAIDQGSLFFAPAEYTLRMYVIDADVFIGEWAVPEPATFLLMGAGMAGIGYKRRKRFKVA